MPNTPTLGLPYPVASDTADVPRDIQALATSIDGQQSFLPVGGLIIWPLAQVPAGVNANGKAAWLFCNGQLVSAVDYPKLAALLGQSGGNVTLPDLRDRLPVGSSATKALLSTGGAATHLLTVAELPAHTHPDNIAYAAAGGHQHSTVSTARNVPAANVAWFDGLNGTAGTTKVAAIVTTGDVSSESNTSIAASHVHGRSGAVQATGGGTAMNTLPPYLSLNFVMRSA